MSASYGIRISLPLPTVGQFQYDGTLDDLLQAVLDVLAARVTPNGLNISSTLDIQGNPLIDCGQLGFSPVSTAPTVGPCLYVNSVGDVHYLNAANVDVQISSGGQLAITVTGAIGGDYTAAQAHLNFVAASNKFTHTDSSLNPSGIEGGSMRLVQPGGSNVATLISPTGLSGSYTLTLPGALPTNGGHALLDSDGAGNLNFRTSSSFVDSIDLAGGVSVDGQTEGLTGWSISGPGTIHMPVNYRSGDRIDGIDLGFNFAGGASITGTLYHRNAFGNLAIIARVGFNDTSTGVIKHINSSTPTLTGSGFPFTPPGTGSLVMQVQSANACAFTAMFVSGTRKLVG